MALVRQGNRIIPNCLQLETVVRRINDLDRSEIAKVDLDEILRRDQIFWSRVFRALMVIVVLIQTSNAMVSLHVHWSIVVPCAFVVTLSFVFLPRIVKIVRGLWHQKGPTKS